MTPLKRRNCETLSRAQLSEMHTGSLMALRRKMLSLEDAPEGSDLMPKELQALDETQHIFFKSDPRWQPQYQAIKEVLDKRENVPTAQERAELRKEAARHRGHGPKG